MRPSTPDYEADYNKKISYKGSETKKRYDKVLSKYEEWLETEDHENNSESLDEYIHMMRNRTKGLSYEGQIRAAVSLKYKISPTGELGRGRHEKKSHRCLELHELRKLFNIVRKNTKYRTILSLAYDVAARAQDI